MNRSVGWIAAVGAVAVLGGGAGYFGYKWLRGAPLVPPIATPAPIGAAPGTAPVAQPAPVEPEVRHPLVGEPAPSLPSLAMSDSSMRAALVDLIGDRAYADWFVTDNLVRRIVATVDNLPRARMSAQLRPVRSAPGSFVTQGDEAQRSIAAANAERYAPLVQIVRKLDVQRVVALYARNYPLFQQAYVDLGYPRGYFNDRLVEAIDDLLAAPEVQGPIALVQPEVMYRYADPALEALSAGQKLLVRMGPAHAAVIKAKLRELRRAVAQAPLAAGADTARGATDAAAKPNTR